MFVHTFSSRLKGGLRRSGFSVVLYQLVKNLEQRLVSLVKLGYEFGYDKDVKKYCNIMPDYSMLALERDGSFSKEDFKIFSQLKNQLKVPTTPEEEIEFIKEVIRIYKRDLPRMTGEDVLKILEEEGIKKENLEKKRWHEKGLHPLYSYETKKNRKGRYLSLMIGIGELKGTFMFRLFDEKHCKWLVQVQVTKPYYILEEYIDKTLTKKLKKPKTSAEEVKFIRKVVKIYKKDLSSEQDYMKICEDIAKDIELLKKEFPQLKEFEVSKNLDKQSCKIRYEYKCHEPSHRGGWTSGVPEPDPEGIWFYIGIWDKNNPSENSSQINTQPVMPLLYIENRRVTYLMLQGKNTNPVDTKIFEILKKYGAKGEYW